LSFFEDANMRIFF